MKKELGRLHVGVAYQEGKLHSKKAACKARK